MKNLIKMIVLIASLIGAAGTTEAFAEEGFLDTLGIYTEVSDEQQISRAEAAVYFSKITGTADTEKKNSFVDLESSHKYFDEINSIVNLRIMTGDDSNKFYPDLKISCMDFLVSGIKLAGFTDYAEAMGGYPDGYIKLIAKYKLLPAGTKMSGPISVEQAETILAKILEMPFCSVKSVVPDGGNVSLNYDMSEEYTVLEHYFSLKKCTGTVTAVGEIYLNGYNSCSTGSITITDSSGTHIYKCFLNTAGSFLGCTVNYYVDTDGEEAVYVINKKDVNIVSLDYNNIAEVSEDRTEITYYDGNDTEKIKIPYDATYIYNGMNCETLNADELHKPNVVIKAVDPDDDKIYEVIFVEEYETVVVGSYVAEGNYVTDKRNAVTYCLDSDEFKYGVEFFSGDEKVDFKYIHRGDILSVTTDKEKKKRKVYISNNIKSGYVEAVMMSDGVITVDSEPFTVYFDLSAADISVGDFIDLHIDYFGRCVEYEKRLHPGGEYAYLLNIAREGAFGNTIKCKYVNELGDIIVTEFDEKFKVNGKSSDYDRLYANLMQGGELHQLVYITLKDGKVKYIEISNEAKGIPINEQYDGFSLDYAAALGQCRLEETIINSQFIAGAYTKGFYIPMDMFGVVNEDEIMAGEYRQLSFKSSIYPKMKLYDISIARVPGAVVVYGLSGKLTNYISGGRLSGSNALVVEKIIERLDNDGEMRTCIQGMLLGMPKYMYPAESLSIDDLKSGDVIRINAYRGDELYGYDKLFTLKRDPKENSTVLSPDNIYSDETPPYNNVGTDSKMSIIGVYGTVEEVGTSIDSTSVSRQNDREPSYSVVIRPKGTAEDGKLVTVNVKTMKMTDTAGTFLYVFNKTTNTVYSVRPNDFEMTGKEVYCFINDCAAKAMIFFEQ